MKTKIILLAGICCFLFAACSKDDNSNGGGSVPDPEGTMTMNMKNNGTDFIYGVRMVSANNFYEYGGKITSVGKINGLGNITKIPSGAIFMGEVAVEVGHGYIWKYDANTYCRAYVCKWLTNTSGGIIGAQVKYQYPFYPENAE